ncbi:MAG: glycosyltransferase family 2 protein [Candidatus Omnitrophica bacterium]|nr:glycosyltransferase family 2 protein [Candidatus Omnitrophota bacterium]
MKLCIVIPIYNEAQEIGEVVEDVKAKGLDVLVVNDGSTDESGEIAKDKGAIVITNPTRGGKGFSLRKGFEYALDNDYDGVITMDGDGQHAVADLDQFIDKIKEFPVSVIAGNRMHNARGMPFVRWMTNRLMSLLISVICGEFIPDSQCGYRYIHSEILRKIKLTCSDFEIETEVLVKAGKLGCKIFSMPIQTIYCNEESRIHPVKDTLRFFSYLIKESKGDRTGKRG